MAEVVVMSDVSGGRSFLISRGSCGVKRANCQDVHRLALDVNAGHLGETYQLDDLDQHPVVLRRREDLKERRGEGQVVDGILARKLGQDVDCGRDDACGERW